MTTKKQRKLAEDENWERLEKAMKRYLEIQEGLSKLQPPKRFVVLPTVDKWQNDVRSLGLSLPTSESG